MRDLFTTYYHTSFVFLCRLCTFYLQDADTLEEKYAEASEILNTKYNETQEVKSQADLLRERARKLFLTTKTRLDSLTREFSQTVYFVMEWIV